MCARYTVSVAPALAVGEALLAGDRPGAREVLPAGAAPAARPALELAAEPAATVGAVARMPDTRPGTSAPPCAGACAAVGIGLAVAGLGLATPGTGAAGAGTGLARGGAACAPR